MWSDISRLNTDSNWGNYVTDLDEEATTVLKHQPFAALLDELALIKIEGEDAETFLQGQLTCDMKAVSQGQAKLGAHCNAKGRAQSTFVTFKANDAFFMLLKANQIEPTLSALNKFAIFSKVTLQASADFQVMGLGGSGIDRTIYKVFSQYPEAGQICELQQTVLIQEPQLGYFAFIEPSIAADTLASLQQAGAALCGDNAWKLAQIQAGITLVDLAIAEHWIPQEINFDLVGGISFDKGCYKGQEIVARIHYRGQTKVRAHLIEINSATPLIAPVTPGDKIIGDSSSGGILEVARVSDHTLRALCTLKAPDSESENLKLEQKDDCQIQVLSLPYAIT